MKLTAILGFLGMIGVALGAFGAHGLEGRLSVEAVGWWQTATFYLLIHAALGTALAIEGKTWRGPAFLFAIGAPLFAFTLYAMALGAPRWLGAVTPLGGLLMLGGWGLVVAEALRRRA